MTNPVSFSLPVRVYYEDTDAGGVVYYANYLKFFERCRSEWLRALGHDQQRLLAEHDLAFVVRRASVDYRKPARLDDLLAIDLAIVDIGRAFLRFRQTARRGDEILATGEVEVVCLVASGFKPQRLPDWLCASLESFRS